MYSNPAMIELMNQFANPRSRAALPGFRDVALGLVWQYVHLSVGTFTHVVVCSNHVFAVVNVPGAIAFYYDGMLSPIDLVGAFTAASTPITMHSVFECKGYVHMWFVSDGNRYRGKIEVSLLRSQILEGLHVQIVAIMPATFDVDRHYISGNCRYYRYDFWLAENRPKQKNRRHRANVRWAYYHDGQYWYSMNKIGQVWRGTDVDSMTELLCGLDVWI